ncbi:MAG: sporulation protein YqfD [Eubacteriales bacterium]
MFYKTLNRATGAYIVKVPLREGIGFINALNQNKVLFWGAKGRDGYMYLRFSVFSFGGGYKTALSQGVEMTVERAYGLPFIIYKYRKRHGLAAGSALGLAVILLSTLFVWKIEVTGNINLPEKEVLAALRESGVELGTYIPSIRVPTVRTNLILNLRDLSSASVNIKGTHITVDVIERKRPPEIADYSGFFHVVAARSGVVDSVEAYEGFPRVTRGDSVIKGQILITGEYKSFREVPIYTHARGSVFAIVKEGFIISVPLNRACKFYTGKEDKKVSYSILGRDFNMFFGALVPFSTFDAEVFQTSLKAGFLSLPIVKTTLITREYVVKTYEITTEIAEKSALDAFNAFCENSGEGPVLKKDYEMFYDKAGGCVTLAGYAERLVNIAVETPFMPTYEDQKPSAR